MAYIADQDEELQNKEAPAAGGAVQTSGGSSANITGGAAPANSGVGKGGTGGWTNLQNYISANQGDTGSASALNDTVTKQFGQESQDMTKASTDYLNNANKQVENSKISNEDADKIVDQAAASYSYDGKAGEDYYGNVNKVKSALTGAYSGPTSYEYGLGAKTQEYGNALGKDGNFDGLLKDVYSSRTASPLSQGQYNLQKQLDVNNTALDETRSKLASDYTNLGAQRDKVVADTTSGLSAAEQAYRTNQNALRDYLTNKASSLDTSIAQQEADARKAYATALSSGSGLKSLGYDTIMGASGNRPDIPLRSNLGVWGDNLSYDQLQREADAFKNGQLQWWTADKAPDLANKQNVLNQFYANQDAQYANVADQDERRFNALQDFLGGTTKKSQGFKVRG